MSGETVIPERWSHNTLWRYNDRTKIKQELGAAEAKAAELERLLSAEADRSFAYAQEALALDAKVAKQAATIQSQEKQLSELMDQIRGLEQMAATLGQRIVGMQDDIASIVSTNRDDYAWSDVVADCKAQAATIERLANARDDRQKTVGGWCVDCFGLNEATSLPQRGIRLLEESAEAAQSCGVSLAQAHHLLEYVWSRPVGDLEQELGGIGITVLALSHAAGLSAEQAEAKEVARILSKPPAHFTKRNQQSRPGHETFSAIQGI